MGAKTECRQVVVDRWTYVEGKTSRGEEQRSAYHKLGRPKFVKIGQTLNDIAAEVELMQSLTSLFL